MRFRGNDGDRAYSPIVTAHRGRRNSNRCGYGYSRCLLGTRTFRYFAFATGKDISLYRYCGTYAGNVCVEYVGPSDSRCYYSGGDRRDTCNGGYKCRLLRCLSSGAWVSSFNFFVECFSHTVYSVTSKLLLDSLDFFIFSSWSTQCLSVSLYEQLVSHICPVQQVTLFSSEGPVVTTGVEVIVECLYLPVGSRVIDGLPVVSPLVLGTGVGLVAWGLLLLTWGFSLIACCFLLFLHAFTIGTGVNYA